VGKLSLDMEKFCFSLGNDERWWHWWTWSPHKDVVFACFCSASICWFTWGQTNLPTTPTKNVRSKIGDALKPMVQWFSHVLLSASPSLSASLPLPCSSYHVVLAARRYRISLPSWPKWDVHYWLVVEPSLWKIWKSDWIIIPTIGENKNKKFQTTNQINMSYTRIDPTKIPPFQWDPPIFHGSKRRPFSLTRSPQVDILAPSKPCSPTRGTATVVKFLGYVCLWTSAGWRSPPNLSGCCWPSAAVGLLGPVGSQRLAL